MPLRCSTIELAAHCEIGWNNPTFSIMNFDLFQSRNCRSNRLAFPNRESSRRHSKIMVEEDGIEPSPLDFQSIVHTEYTTLPL